MNRHWLWKHRQLLSLAPIVIVGFLLARHFPKLDPWAAFVTPIIVAVFANWLIYVSFGIDLIDWFPKKKIEPQQPESYEEFRADYDKFKVP